MSKTAKPKAKGPGEQAVIAVLEAQARATAAEIVTAAGRLSEDARRPPWSARGRGASAGESAGRGCYRRHARA